MTLRLQVPRKLKPLLAPARYKGAFGGRGGAKSHFFAEQLVMTAYVRPIRAVCIREVQNSIKDSVRQLLIDKIQKFELGQAFDVLDGEIRGKNGSLIVFRGMQSYNAENIKSLEDYNIAWVEEAQTLSAHSLRLLRPTIRAKGSELWFSWNPRHRTDPVDVFFRKSPHPKAVSVMVNWRDNPWFPDELKEEMHHDKDTDPDGAEHIWEGAYGMIEGAILGRWVNKAYKQGRIHNEVIYDPTGSPIEISSDIGRRDTASWWFWQRKVGGFSLIDYDEGRGLYAGDWIVRLQDRLAEMNYKLGKIWLPHDARTKTFAAKHSAIHQFIKGNPDEGIVGFGPKKVDIVPQTSIEDRINAGRTIIGRCEFAEDRCEKGIDGLLAWEYELDEENQVFRKVPLHNFASHPSDAYTYGCQVMQTMDAPEDEPEEGQFWHERKVDELFWPKESQRDEWL